MFGCLFVLLALISPRLGIILLWIFTSRLSVAFESFWLPLLGFFFLPITTLIYALVYDPVTGVPTFGWFLVAFGFLADLGVYAGGGRRRRR